MSFEIVPPARYEKSSHQRVVRSFGGGEWFLGHGVRGRGSRH